MNSKYFTHPFTLGMIALLVAGGILRMWPLLLIGGFGLVGSMALRSMKESSALRDIDDVSEDSKRLLKPLKSQMEDIEKIIADNSERPIVSVIGKQALQEGQSIVNHADRIVAAYEKLKGTIKAQNAAKVELQDLERRLELAESEAESAALEMAIHAKAKEIERYEFAQEAIDKLESKIREADAAMTEIKARLASTAVAPQAYSLDSGEIEGMVSRLRSLSESFDETQQMLENQNV